MSDLISRKELLRMQADYWLGLNDKQNLVIEVIKDMSTAYDVEKVLEKIEARRYNFSVAAGVLTGADVRAETYAHALEIVKGGLEE